MSRPASGKRARGGAWRRGLYEPLERTQGVALAATAALGLLGAWPRAATGCDPLALVAWLVLIGPALGFLAGALGVRLFPLGLLAPGLWLAALVQVDIAAERDLAAALAPGLFVCGLYLLGLGLGARSCARGPLRAGHAARGAGLLAFATLALAAAPLVPGVLAGESGLAASRPGVARVLLAASPLGMAFDAAEWDWTHGNPPTYRWAGIDWIARAGSGGRRGGLAAAALLVVGCLSAVLLPLRGKRSEPQRS
jgi:hypothetical protein